MKKIALVLQKAAAWD